VQADDVGVLEQLERPDLPPNLQTPNRRAVSNRLTTVPGKMEREIITWSSMCWERILFRSRILMAKWPPVARWRAYLTLPKLPSPRVRPISYLPSSDARVHCVSASPFTIHKLGLLFGSETDQPTPHTFRQLSLSLVGSAGLRGRRRKGGGGGRGGEKKGGQGRVLILAPLRLLFSFPPPPVVVYSSVLLEGVVYCVCVLVASSVCLIFPPIP
jgi:hypothetical protein